MEVGGAGGGYEADEIEIEKSVDTETGLFISPCCAAVHAPHPPPLPLPAPQRPPP